MEDNKNKRVTIIILNYNSWQDTIECIELLQKIDYPDYLMVVVDNASSDGSIEKIKLWADESDIKVIEYEKEIAEQGGIRECEEELQKYPIDQKIILIKNHANLGYSAGNNVGIRYAIKKGAEAVLIVNPDIRIEDPSTLQKMVDVMFSDDPIYIVGPNVIDAKGNRQNPLREPSFLEEIINPFKLVIFKRLGQSVKYYLEPIRSNKPYKVEKIAGCCLLIRTSFLKIVGLLDENVFLYCEEPILAAQVQKHKGEIVFVPEVSVYHYHKKPTRFQMQIFFKSRLYYHKQYNKYNFIQLFLITMAYKAISIFWRKKLN